MNNPEIKNLLLDIRNWIKSKDDWDSAEIEFRITTAIAQLEVKETSIDLFAPSK
jgi:hypothetical protein